MAMFKRENRVGSAKIACTALVSGIMALSMPMTAMAGTYYLEDGYVTVNATTDGQTVTQYNNPEVQNVSDASPVISNRNFETSTQNQIIIEAAADSTANVTFSGVNIDCSGGAAAVGIGGDGNVNIELNGSNTLKAGGSNAAIQDNNDGMLTIKDENGDGRLRAEGGGSGGAGIGSAAGSMASGITISGGMIEAIGGNGAAGIGGGNDGTGSDITISGGTVNARGGQYGAGIGGGENRAGSNITISGGTVTATGGSKGAGIGGGDGTGTGIDDEYYGSVTNILISGGTVTAIGKNSGAGIGAGRGKTSTGITISGAANVSAAGGDVTDYSLIYGAGAAIGGGGRNNQTAGTEIVNTSNLYTTGSVRLFNAGTQADQMNDEGNLQTDTEGNRAVIQGTVPPPASVTPVSSDSNVESSGSGNNNDSGSPSQPTVNGFAVFLSTLNTQIGNNLKQVNSQIASGNLEAAKAKYPDGYTINTGNWISFKRDTYELLDKLIQAGVPVIINFTYKGKSYSVTIPAGSAVSLVSLCNKEGYCGFMNLYRVFGGTVK